jgi:sulfur transfer protein SufE
VSLIKLIPIHENQISHIHYNIILLNTFECQNKLFIIMGHNKSIHFLPGTQTRLYEGNLIIILNVVLGPILHRLHETQVCCG